MDVLTCVFRTYYAVKISPLRTKELFHFVVMPTIIVAVIVCFICNIISMLLPEDLFGFFGLLVLNSASLVIVIYIVGLNKKERKLRNSMFANIKTRLLKK